MMVPRATLKISSEVRPSNDSLRRLFDQYLPSYLKTISPPNALRPVPPLLGNGKSVDLFKLFFTVREKGGCDAVSINGLWTLVANESGLGLGISSPLKLVYAQYLEPLEKLLKIADSKSSNTDLEIVLRDLGAGFKAFLNEMNNNSKEKNEEYPTLTNYEDTDCVKNVLDTKNVEIIDINDSDGDDEDVDVVILDPDHSNQISSIGRKRKRQSMWLQMLQWVANIAKDPRASTVCSLPECSQWSSYGKEEIWKQVLDVREELLVKGKLDSTQRTQKMHPYLYDDQTGPYNLRERNLLSEKALSKSQSCSPSSHASSLKKNHGKRTPNVATDEKKVEKMSVFEYDHKRRHYLGPRFEAEIPEWEGVEVYNSDTKWLGTKIFPLQKSSQRTVIELDPIGKGRGDSCACRVINSIECVRFHIAEKRMRLKVELGSAFYYWEFDKMGEEVALSWTKEEEKKFIAILNTEPPHPLLWAKQFKSFTSQSRRTLVSYYYNVFLLRRRADQNRNTPEELWSCDEKEDNEPLKNSSYQLRSPAKSRKR